VNRNGQELKGSYYQHLVVRRKIKNPFEDKHTLFIHNYIDIGLEMAFRKEKIEEQQRQSSSTTIASGDASSSFSSISSAAASAELRLGGSIQLNKNSLVKFRFSRSDFSLAAIFKSWFDPSVSVGLNVSYPLGSTGAVGEPRTGRNSMLGGRLGLNVAIENVGDVLFDRTPQNFHRVVPNQKQDVTLQYETQEDY